MTDIHSISLTLRGQYIELIVEKEDGQLNRPVTIKLKENQQLVFCQPQAFYIKDTAALAILTEELAKRDDTCPDASNSEQAETEAAYDTDFPKSELTMGDLLREDTAQFIGDAESTIGMTESSVADMPELLLAATSQQSIAGEPGETGYRCDVCGEIFKNRHDLPRHAVIHTGVKLYSCNFAGCDYSSFRSSHFQIHKRKHTGERPYTCDFPECSYSSCDSSHLQRHKRRHTGEKPYSCDFADCKAAFLQNCHLITHKRTHTGERPYLCDFPSCTYSSAQSSNLASHKRASHS